MLVVTTQASESVPFHVAFRFPIPNGQMVVEVKETSVVYLLYAIPPGTHAPDAIEMKVKGGG